jgi:Holliday junction resolvasome RuvABC endonuclease subunit
MSVIVGVDLSTQSCGLAVLHDGVLQASWQLEVRDDRPWHRLYAMAMHLAEHFPPRPTLVVFEALRLFHAGRISLAALRDLGRLQGIVGLYAHQRGAQALEVAVQHWRKAVLGDGRATKEDVVRWARALAQRDVATDEAEAIALAYYGYLWQTKKFRPRKGGLQGGSYHRRRTRSVDRRSP